MFSGTLNGDIGACSDLKTAKLEHNEFSGDVPKEIGDCENLRYCSLSNNDFNLATVPFRRLQQSPKLQLLDLRANSGKIDENWYKDELFRTNGVDGVKRRMMCFEQRFKETQASTILVVNDTFVHARVDGHLYESAGPKYMTEAEEKQETRNRIKARDTKKLFPEDWEVESHFTKNGGRYKITCFKPKKIVFRAITDALNHLENLQRKGLVSMH